jgi:DNA polymerase IV (DinB-like DNA polymerase)
MSGETLPGAPDPDQRIVLHVDMDCFYASCERLREPALDDEPVVVGMGYEPGSDHGAVATASYEARDHGVESAQAISKAVQQVAPIEYPSVGDDDAPRGHYRPVDMEYYKSVAASIKEILREYADTVREVSIDEAYLDATERTAWEVVTDSNGRPRESAATGATGGERTLAEGLARHIKSRIDREVGVPASVGVAPNMSTAKIASDYDKPDGLVVVRPDRVRSFLEPLAVEQLHGVGPVTARELHSMGIDTAGDVAEADPAVLHDRFGERGRELYARARGRDDREVTPKDLPKSLSRESAFTEATEDQESAREKVTQLAADVAERAHLQGALYGTIGIKVVTPPFDVHTRARSLSGPVDDPELVEEVALDLLAEFESESIRKLGVRVSSLEFADADQSTLGGFKSDGSTPTEPDATAMEDDDSTSATGVDSTTANDQQPADDRVDSTTEEEPTDGQFSITEFE